jgi:hypothetical protein
VANYVRDLQPDMRPGYFRLITASVDDVGLSRGVRTITGAQWPFLSDADRKLITELDIVDVTDETYSPVAIPFTWVLDGDLTIHKVYFGWWHVGRPTAEDLRRDFRELMSRRRDWVYSAHYDYHGIHSDDMYQLTHGMMDKFIDLAHERVQPR